MRKYNLGKKKRGLSAVVEDSRKEFGHGVRWIDWQCAVVEEKDIKEVKQKGRGGWLVLEHGCIYPVLYCNNSELAAIRRALGQVSGPLVATPNGWPINLESSVLCHDHNCVNGRHAVLEPSWVNTRRNHCRGTLPNGEHDCRMEPPCIAQYTATDKGYNQPGGISVPPRYVGPLTPEATQGTFRGLFPPFTEEYDPLAREETKKSSKKRKL